ncbi:hypothetical protein, partial [Thiolapillus sp.]|uniref:hypothetical protein n=1 Tax=Thiolapillus sp. TaxID=2017437 RepID=UPI003AF57DE8
FSPPKYGTWITTGVCAGAQRVADNKKPPNPSILAGAKILFAKIRLLAQKNAITSTTIQPSGSNWQHVCPRPCGICTVNFHSIDS